MSVTNSVSIVNNRVIITVHEEPNLFQKVKNFSKEHRVATTAVAVGVGCSAGFLAAPAIATKLGAIGLLGTTANGTLISSLKGVALTKAALAKIGGGAIAQGGYGIAGGKTFIAATAGTAGGAANIAATKNK